MKMKMTELLKWVFGTFVSIFIAAYLFNHFSPWMAVVFVAALLYVLASRFQTRFWDSGDDDSDDADEEYRKD